MKKIMLVAGGNWQVPMAKKIKDMGCSLICNNLYENSPAFKYADFSYVANVLDIEKNLEIAKKHDIDAILSEQSDISMATIATIAEKLQLKTNGLGLAKLFSNKVEMRKYCMENNFPSPKFKACHCIKDAEDFFVTEDRKIIIKPQDSQASRGVFIISSIEDIAKYYALSAAESHGDGTVIAEDYVQGKEFTIDGVFINGKHHSLAISKKRHYSYNPNVSLELFFSQSDDFYDYEQLRRQNNTLMESTGAKMGLTHNEYKFDGKEFKLIEMSNRGGGNLISSHIVPLMSGIDNYAIYIKQVLGEKIDSLEAFRIAKAKNFAVLKFVDDSRYKSVENGIICNISGVDIIEKHPNMIKLWLDYKIGDKLSYVSDDTKRKIFYIAHGDSLEDMQKIDDFVNNTLNIELKSE